MVVGVLQFELLIHDAQSLKDKRRVVRSIKDRLHREHQVCVAEIGALDHMGLALLGVACVAIDGRRVGDIFDHITTKLKALRGAELGDTSRELFHAPVMGWTDTPDTPDTNADLARELLARMEAPVATKADSPTSTHRGSEPSA